MYWKLDTDFYMSKLMREVTRPTCERDGYAVARESILIRLLTMSANNRFFDSCKHFSRLTDLPIKQCQIVWDVCERLGVVRCGKDGYSALEWMHENNLTYQTQKKPQPLVYSEEKPIEKVDTKPVVVEKPKPVLSQEQPEKPQDLVDWIYARPNVRLRRWEFDTLCARHTADEVSGILDTLADYKTRSHRNYASDFQAIERWVEKSYMQKKEATIPFFQTGKEFEAPSWITGKKQ